MAEFFSGRVVAVTFANTESAFYIVKMKLDREDGEEGTTVTVRGNIPAIPIQVGSWFGFQGAWQTHKQWGEQLVVKKAPILKNGLDAEAVTKLLLAQGLNPKILLILKNHFGDQLVPALSDIEKLQEAPTVTKFNAIFIKSKWDEIVSWFATVDLFEGLGVPKNIVTKVQNEFGSETAEIMKTNPWKAIQVDGFTLEHADAAALKFGLDLTDFNRNIGAVLHVVKNQKGMGHLYSSSGEVLEGVQKICPASSTHDIASAIKLLNNEGHIVIDTIPETSSRAIYEPWFHHVETYTAEKIVQRMETAKLSADKELEYIKKLGTIGPKTLQTASIDNVTLREVAETAVHEWCEMTSLNLSQNQREGVVNAIVEPVSVLTGLPGTGKTTSLKLAVKVFQDAGVSFLLIAPTGIAAKRIASVTGAPASTVHRAFGAKNAGKDGEGREAGYTGFLSETSTTISSDGSDEEWGFNENSPHPAEVVFVDESSMVDQSLLYRLMSCTSPTCRLVFIGDAAQLPSVGPGNVLRDLINSKLLPVINLVDIFRQQDTSGIVTAAHAVHRGDVPDFKNNKDFVFLPIDYEDEILSAILKLSEKFYTTRQNFQVISSRHMGTLGVTNLNLKLRELLNPGQEGLTEMKFGDWNIREGDRVMVVKNNYKLEIYNGDIGKISKIDKKSREVEIKIFGPPVVTVRMSFSDIISHLRLAYGTTIHKCQGLEFDNVIMPFVDSFAHQLQRNLFYTAITRAKTRVIIVGHASAIHRAVGNNRESYRNTLFIDRLLKQRLTTSEESGKILLQA